MSGSTMGLHTNTSIVIVMINLQISQQQQQPNLFSYMQVGGRLEMKLIELKNRDKTKVKKKWRKEG
jgi:hypothetical protein